MLSSLTKLPALYALVLGLGVMGCMTALAITGHIAGADVENVVLLVLGLGGATTAAHVGGAVSTSAASNAVASTPAPNPAFEPTATVPVTTAT